MSGRKYDAQEVIERVAKVSIEFGAMVGVGALETAGGIIGYLAENPRDLEPFMNGGIRELPDDHHERHNLTWHAVNGKVVHPSHVRRARTIKGMLKQSPTPEKHHDR